MNFFRSPEVLPHALVPILLLAQCAGCSDGGSAHSSDASAGASADPIYAELFDDAVPHEFIIEISQEEWEGITQDMLDYAATFPVTPLYTGDGREYRTDKYRKADFIYRRADGTEVKLEQVGIRTRGNESRRLPYQNGQFYKSHFKVKFDETFDMATNDPNHAAIDRRRFAGLKALNFKWSRYNSWTPTPTSRRSTSSSATTSSRASMSPRHACPWACSSSASQARK